MSTNKFKLIQYPSCKVCFKNYDQTHNQPTTVVPCCHTFCSDCINCLTDKKCPTCRMPIREKSVNWELLSLLPDESSDSNSTQFFKFENEPKVILLSEANKTLENFADLVKSSSKANLEKSELFKEKLKTKTEEVIGKILFNQQSIIKRVEQAEINYKNHLKEISLKEKDIRNRIRKIDTNDLDELLVNTSQVQQFIKLVGQKNNEFDHELSRLESEENLLDFLISQSREQSMTNHLMPSQNGLYYYVIKSSETREYGLTLDEKFFIKTIDFDSPAYKAGLKESYKIVEINGISTGKSSYFDMLHLMKTCATNLTLGVIRFKRIMVKIPNSVTSFGLSISTLKEHSYKFVIKVETNSPAYFKGLKENDVIFEINSLCSKRLEMNQIKAILTDSLKKKEAEFLVLNHDDFNALVQEDFSFE